MLAIISKKKKLKILKPSRTAFSHACILPFISTVVLANDFFEISVDCKSNGRFISVSRDEYVSPSESSVNGFELLFATQAFFTFMSPPLIFTS